jgi:hypothetical protein
MTTHSATGNGGTSEENFCLAYPSGNVQRLASETTGVLPVGLSEQ